MITKDFVSISEISMIKFTARNTWTGNIMKTSELLNMKEASEFIRSEINTHPEWKWSMEIYKED